MDKSIIASEFSFKAVRSSGAGGQNVNKVSSKVVLTFDLVNSKGLTDDEKTLLQTKITGVPGSDNRNCRCRQHSHASHTRKHKRWFCNISQVIGIQRIRNKKRPTTSRMHRRKMGDQCSGKAWYQRRRSLEQTRQPFKNWLRARHVNPDDIFPIFLRQFL